MRHEAMLWKSLKDGQVECGLCAHRCGIAKDRYGVCGMRQNIEGELFTYAYGEIVAGHVDPIEKKPFYHFLPDSYTYSIATAGCNFKCKFCQNSTISQQSAKKTGASGHALSPADAVAEAIRNDCMSIAYTYTEPTVFFEYAYDISKIARSKGLSNVFVTNGYMTPEAIDTISPYLDAANVDLKFFDDNSYRDICGGRLQPVLDSIRKLKESGIWVEVTTLVIPGLNDSEEELNKIASFLADLDTGIPWHISRFHPDYEMNTVKPTPVETMITAKRIGESMGLKYVYLGNIYPSGDTICSGCKSVVVKTPDFLEMGKCSKCGTVVEGVWR